MADWLQPISERFMILEPIDYFTLSLNLLVFVFSRQFATKYGQLKDQQRSSTRLRLLRQINMMLFVGYFLAVIFKFHLASSFSQTCLVVLCTYLFIHFMEAVILARYGREIAVEGLVRKVDTYTSRTMEILTSAVIVCVALVVLINIWGFESWLETTSVIGFLALVFFATKDYWAGDFLSGIIVMGDGRIERGNVIRIPDENLLGVVLQIRTVQTIIRDLVCGHDITIPNSYLVKKRVDIYKTDLQRGFFVHVDFKIGYGTPVETVQKYMSAVWETAAKQAGVIDSERECRIELIGNEDHAALWRLSYVLRSPHGLITARNKVNLAAYTLQEEYGVSISTPLVYTIDSHPAQLSMPVPS